MIADVLERSRQQASRAELRFVPLDLVELVTRSIEQNMLPAERGRIEVETVESVPVVVDAVGMERVIVNLLSNACKYSPPSSPVVVRMLRVDHAVVISVTDQGVGIDAKDLPRLFEKHFRAGTAGTVEGTGLGLYGSWQTVEAHGGRIWAQSIVGAGTTFLVSLPASASGLHANKQDEGQKDAPDPSQSATLPL